MKKEGKKSPKTPRIWWKDVAVTLCGMFLLVFCGWYVGEQLKRVQPLISLKHVARAEEIPLTLTPTPTLTPTLTLTPTPSVEPTPVYKGFCLQVPVLMYHHVSPQSIAVEKGHTSLNVDSGIFDGQMGYLAAHGYTTYFAEDVVNALLTHTPLPGKPIVVTLDDGYDDVYTYAFPSMRKYGIKASLFVPTGLMGVTAGTNAYYNWGQLSDMVGSGLARAYNHTWSHHAMGSSEDAYEITTAQTQLQQHGFNTHIFAYPYGTNAGLASVHTILQSQGIPGAFSTIGGTVQCDSFIMSLHRTRVGNTAFPAYGIY